MKRLNRRQFLGTAASTVTAAAALTTGCSPAAHSDDEALIQRITPEMRAGKPIGNSTVALIVCESYEENLKQLMNKWVKDLALPNLTGKTVVVKPNMIEYRPNYPITTNPAVVGAAIGLARELGAKEVVVAEGPGHFRDTEYLLHATGIGQLCKEMDVRFVDLNLDELEKVPNTNGLCKTDHFFLPRTVINSGALISVPKLKTHHWAGMTCSMKNLFGVVPGRKYGWPKNFLHWQGITSSILDLVRLVKPVFALVDAVVAMEGDGPINGTACKSGFIALGTDVAAVDSTCARTMKIDPASISYLKIAEEIIGNTKKENIQILGTPIESLVRLFKLPLSEEERKKYSIEQAMSLSS